MKPEVINRKHPNLSLRLCMYDLKDSKKTEKVHFKSTRFVGDSGEFSIKIGQIEDQLGNFGMRVALFHVSKGPL